ncbi:MAG: DM13 domain-containing protein [Candidatus Kerfeldbacteria bacterium]|nr:DM13 domain-containing protein [Candidatus Kerfeldbacteria bacterium]
MPQTSPRPSSLWFDDVPDRRRFPILEQSLEADVAIVGGGIVGLLAAWHLARRGKRIVLLEKNHIASGDTGATTAFLSRVPDADLAALLAKHGASFVAQVCEAARVEQEELCTIITSQNFACDFKNVSSYYGAYEKDDTALEQTWNSIPQSVMNAKRVSKETVPSLPFVDAIEFQNEGTLHIRKFLHALADVLSSTISIYEESEVIRVEDGEHVTLRTPNGSVTAQTVLVAVGDPSGLFPETTSLIERFVTFVVAGQTSDTLAPALYWDTNDPYYYFRPVGDHTLMVGGADMPFGKANQQTAVSTLQDFISEHCTKSFTLTHSWSGSIFHTSDGLPYVFRHTGMKGQVMIATGFAGNGLVFGPLAAKILASSAIGKAHEAQELFALSRTGAALEKRATETFQKTAHGFVPLGSLSDFPEGKPVCKTIDGKPIMACQLNGKVYAIDNQCSHAGGSLCEGELDGKVIQCPLHAGRFDITTGAVIGPPPIRPQASYRTRVQNGNVDIDLAPSPSMTQPSAPRAIRHERHWGTLLKFLPIPLALWIVQFILQYTWLTKDELGGSLLRSFALTGATLISAALFSSIVFKFVPRLARHWRIRRYLGVSGFVFIALHVLSVYHFFFDYNVRAVYYSFNPIENPMIFGSVAFGILFLMAATSSDWAVQKLSPKRWKFLHRFVYIAEISTIFHFLFINPQLLKNPPGYVLLTLIGLTVLGQLYWWIRLSAKRQFRTGGTVVGVLLILLVVVLGVLEYRHLNPPAPQLLTPREEPLEESVEKMKEFMQGGGTDTTIATEPPVEDQAFAETVVKQGKFENLNYMTSGAVHLEEKDGAYMIVFQDSFTTPNGPDLQLYLTKNTEPTSREDIAAGVNIGKLKSTNGKQVYPIPDSVDISDIHSVTIHCKAFNVPWSYAVLQ